MPATTLKIVTRTQGNNAALKDGSVRSLDPADPAAIELQGMAADLRRAFETGD